MFIILVLLFLSPDSFALRNADACQELLGMFLSLKTKAMVELNAGKRFQLEYENNPKLDLNSDRVRYKLATKNDCSIDIIKTLKAEFSFHKKNCFKNSLKDLMDVKSIEQYIDSQMFSPTICSNERKQAIIVWRKNSLEISKTLQQKQNNENMCDKIINQYNQNQTVLGKIVECQEKKKSNKN